MTGYVYFLKPKGMVGPIKIGFTSGPSAEHRLNYYAALSPFPLEMVVRIEANLSHERALHDHFADCHSHNEWFHATPRLLNMIARIKMGEPLDEVVDLDDVRGNVRSITHRAARGRLKLTDMEISPHVEAAE